MIRFVSHLFSFFLVPSFNLEYNENEVYFNWGEMI